MCVELPCGYSSQTIAKIIAYCGITIYACLTAVIALLGLVIESREDILSNGYSTSADLNYNDSQAEENYTVTRTKSDSDSSASGIDDLTQFLEMQMSDPIRICFVIWIVLNIVTGLVISIILLQGAQERNLFKVRTWFYATIIIYLLWIPIYAYWVCHAVDPVNVLMSGFMTYMLGGLCLWVVSGFIEELRIESISHRIGYKDILVPFYKI